MPSPKDEAGGSSDGQHWRNGAAGAKSFLYSDLVFDIKMTYNSAL